MEIRGKSLERWRQNAEENYLTTPISVLKYITVLEEYIASIKTEERNSVEEGEKEFVCCEDCCDIEECKSYGDCSIEQGHVK